MPHVASLRTPSLKSTSLNIKPTIQPRHRLPLSFPSTHTIAVELLHITLKLPSPSILRRSMQMHRLSASGVLRDDADEFSINVLQNSLPSLKTSGAANYDLLPSSDSLDKKEIALLHKTQQRERAVHLIPVILILCGFILWLFSYPTHVA